jgi:hypothetical protein
MTHEEFIQKMIKYEEINTFHAQSKDFKSTANNFGTTPQAVGVAVRFVQDHKFDPRHPELGKLQHNTVIEVSDWCDLKSPETTRKHLVDKYKAHQLDGPMNHWPDEIPKGEAEKLLTLFGVKWFQLNGYPFAHWNQL